jgi:hypothetical protein
VIDLKVLPLHCYDIILGMDWLASCSPMEIHWQKKWLTFTQGSTKVVLQGQVFDASSREQITVQQCYHLEQLEELWCTMELQKSAKRSSQQALPEGVQQLIQEFASLFDKPIGLPHARPHCHAIPLIPEVVPFRLRPYHYNLAKGRNQASNNGSS